MPEEGLEKFPEGIASSLRFVAIRGAGSILISPLGLFYSAKFKVPGAGLEPASLAAYAPEAYVFANFTTRARLASLIATLSVAGLSNYFNKSLLNSSTISTGVGSVSLFIAT